MTDDMLGILIGKFLDSEITADEKRILDAKLAEDARAREIFDGFRQVQRLAVDAISEDVRNGGRSAGEIFEICMERRISIGARIARYAAKRWVYAASLAAGIIVGMAIFALVFETSRTGTSAGLTGMEAKSVIDSPVDTGTDIIRDEFMRNVDWYNFTDSQGSQWLLEGYRQDRVVPVAYDRDL